MDRAEDICSWINDSCLHVDAIATLERAIVLLTEKGRFQRAAKHKEDIAGIYESELIDLDKAMVAYETAGDWYAGESSAA